jgi:hypothetical protein
MRETVTMRKRAPARNECKTRLPDDVYERMQLFKQLNCIESDSEALARLARYALFGILPPPFDPKED